MKKKDKTKYLFIIFPYLKTNEKINLFGLDFYNSKDLSEFNNPVKKHLKTLFDMFYLRDNLKLTDMVFLYKEYKTDKEKWTYIFKVLKAQALITYIYSSPHPTDLETFIKKEYVDFYIFHPDNHISKFLIKPDQYVEQVGANKYPKEDKFGCFEGYNGQLNNEKHLWVTKGSRIYPSEPHFGHRYYQDLSSDFNHPDSRLLKLCNKIMESNVWQTENFDNRVFNALKWYNRSFSWTATEDVEIINLAIALETLLGLEEGESVTKRFKESVKLLVGPINNLDIWLDQFYKVRSEIVHDGASNKLMFYKHNDGKEKLHYRPLVSYGRIIFTICLNAIFSGIEMTYHMRLPELFTTNKERFEKICKLLGKSPSKLNAFDEIIPIIYELEKYSFVAEDGLDIKLMLSSLKCTAENLLETVKDIPHDVKIELDNLARPIPKDNEGIYKRLNSLHNLSSYGNLDNRTNAFLTLSNVVWRYTMFKYFQLDSEFKNSKQRDNKVEIKDSSH